MMLGEKAGLAVEEEKIESVEHRAFGLVLIEGGLKLGKRRPAALVKTDRFAVDHGRAHLQRHSSR